MPSNPRKYYPLSEAQKIIFSTNRAINETLKSMSEHGYDLSPAHLKILLASKQLQALYGTFTVMQVFDLLKEYCVPIKSKTYVYRQFRHLVKMSFIVLVSDIRFGHSRMYSATRKTDFVLRSLTRKFNETIDSL